MFVHVRTKSDAWRLAWQVTGTAAFATAILGALFTAVFINPQYAVVVGTAGLIIPTAFLPWMTYHAAQSAALLQVANTAIEGFSRMDTTTGLLNRLGFAEMARTAFAKARKETSPLSAIVIDVDHLKSINQLYGFAGGDAALTYVAQALSLNIQAGVDIAGRYGGAEFALLLPEADYAWASSFAERLRGTLANRPVQFDGKLIPISASFGVASILSVDEAPEALIARASKALQTAKNGGRNKVEVAPEQMLIAA